MTKDLKSANIGRGFWWKRHKFYARRSRYIFQARKTSHFRWLQIFRWLLRHILHPRHVGALDHFTLRNTAKVHLVFYKKFWVAFLILFESLVVSRPLQVQLRLSILDGLNSTRFNPVKLDSISLDRAENLKWNRAEFSCSEFSFAQVWHGQRWVNRHFSNRAFHWWWRLKLFTEFIRILSTNNRNP